MLVDMSVREEVTPVVEEYLECVFKLQERRRVARTSEIVRSLGVAPGTVTNTVEWLEKERLVTHRPYRGVRLTKKGRRIALQVIRRHRLSERLLTDILRMDWDEVHDAACKLEHGITDKMIRPLEKALRHPKTCPHGNPIPTKCGGVIQEDSRPLVDLLAGEKSTIVKIEEESADLLRYLNDHGLVPGVSVEILEKAPMNGPITLKAGLARHAVSRAMASIIQVKRK